MAKQVLGNRSDCGGNHGRVGWGSVSPRSRSLSHIIVVPSGASHFTTLLALELLGGATLLLDVIKLVDSAIPTGVRPEVIPRDLAERECNWCERIYLVLSTINMYCIPSDGQERLLIPSGTKQNISMLGLRHLDRRL
ncbi:hypothetical protein BDV93DRAFT_373051 [Ceratobasidium sp. AG-I]|nr:hypothetical protein BDV93DRAFT_373051 [Ceratobasidium sp. AG-I]